METELEKIRLVKVLDGNIFGHLGGAILKVVEIDVRRVKTKVHTMYELRWYRDVFVLLIRTFFIIYRRKKDELYWA